MSEAKLWEAIQEANVELSRARQQQATSEQKSQEQATGGNVAVVAPALNCALPPCFIK